ncbi:putative quinol monooxygenase [Actinokineospora sp.]|uniref:putative quinol monooxygenase n=1 Tax=Actinokineospora sp. TaxID=1872133 RepID=UPI0040379CA4
MNRKKKVGLAIFAMAAVTGVAAPVVAAAQAPAPMTEVNSFGHQSTRSVYVVVAELTGIKPAFQNMFIRAAQADARCSARNEPGTLSFVVAPDPQDQSRFVLSETYADKRAWETHRDGKCFADFFAIVGPNINPPRFVIEGPSIEVPRKLT